MAKGFVWSQIAGPNQLPAQAMRPLIQAPNLSVHHSGIPGGCLVWPLLQSLEGSSLNSHPGVEDEAVDTQAVVPGEVLGVTALGPSS